MDQSTIPIKPSRSDQLTTYFRNPEYLRAVGGQLTQYTVLDYFSKSDYYEQGCNNAILQMQSAATNVPFTHPAEISNGNSEGLSAWERKNDPFIIEQELKRFTGLEYVLVHAKQPDLFVIHKRWRSSPTITNTLEAYYVLQGNITMAADILAILGNKFVSTVSSLQQSLQIARNAQPDFNPREGYAWRIAAEAQAEDTNEGDDEQGVDTIPDQSQRDETMTKVAKEVETVS
jgi:mediator of RNA polymerase II transcription subunit 6